MANPAKYYVVASVSLRTMQPYDTLDEAHNVARREVTDGYGPRTIVVSVQEEIIGVVVTNKHDAPTDVFGVPASREVSTELSLLNARIDYQAKIVAAAESVGNAAAHEGITLLDSVAAVTGATPYQCRACGYQQSVPFGGNCPSCNTDMAKLPPATDPTRTPVNAGI